MMSGFDTHDMSGWAWALMTLITLLWLVVAGAAVYIAVALTRGRQNRPGGEGT